MSPQEFPRTIAALREFGKVEAIAEAMDASERSVFGWLAGDIPAKRMQRWARHESVWNALRLDLLALPTEE